MYAFLLLLTMFRRCLRRRLDEVQLFSRKLFLMSLIIYNTGTGTNVGAFSENMIIPSLDRIVIETGCVRRHRKRLLKNCEIWKRSFRNEMKSSRAANEIRLTSTSIDSVSRWRYFSANNWARTNRWECVCTKRSSFLHNRANMTHTIPRQMTISQSSVFRNDKEENYGACPRLHFIFHRTAGLIKCDPA